jgi:hypothetical protein
MSEAKHAVLEQVSDVRAHAKHSQSGLTQKGGAIKRKGSEVGSKVVGHAKNRISKTKSTCSSTRVRNATRVHNAAHVRDTTCVTNPMWLALSLHASLRQYPAIHSSSCC